MRVTHSTCSNPPGISKAPVVIDADQIKNLIKEQKPNKTNSQLMKLPVQHQLHIYANKDALKTLNYTQNVCAVLIQLVGKVNTLVCSHCKDGQEQFI